MNRSLLISDIDGSNGEATRIVTKDVVADERPSDPRYRLCTFRSCNISHDSRRAGLDSSTIWPVKVSRSRRKITKLHVYLTECSFVVQVCSLML
jgi:hypothetical protein